MTIPQIKPISAIASANTSEMKSFTKMDAELEFATTRLDPKTPTVKAATTFENPTAAHPKP